MISIIDSCCRLILENLLKYGWRLNFISYISRSLAGRGNLPLVLAFPALVALSLLALTAERLGLYCITAEEQVHWGGGGGGGRGGGWQGVAGGWQGGGRREPARWG